MIPQKEDVYTIRGIPVPLLDRFWPFAIPYIKRALDHASGEFEVEDVKTFCTNRDMQLWLISHNAERVVGAGTTEIIIYPRRKICRIVTLSGSNFKEWASIVEPALLEWAQANGCDGMEAWVRRGFVPTLKEMGYSPKFNCVIKDIPIKADIINATDELKESL